MQVKALQEVGLIRKYSGIRSYQVTPLLTDLLMVNGMKEEYIVKTNIPSSFKYGHTAMKVFSLEIVGGDSFKVSFSIGNYDNGSFILARFDCVTNEVILATTLGNAMGPKNINLCHKCIAEAIRLCPERKD